MARPGANPRPSAPETDALTTRLSGPFCGNRSTGSVEEDNLKGFYSICAWRPSWSYDPDAANKLSSLTHRSSTQNLALICYAVWTNICLNIVNDGGPRSEEHGYSDYKLTYDP